MDKFHKELLNQAIDNLSKVFGTISTDEQERIIHTYPLLRTIYQRGIDDYKNGYIEKCSVSDECSDKQNK